MRDPRGRRCLPVQRRCPARPHGATGRNRTWRPPGDPEKVRVHDFKDEVLGKAVPYGVCDVAADAGWVSVGVDHDTAEFAVETLRR